MKNLKNLVHFFEASLILLFFVFCTFHSWKLIPNYQAILISTIISVTVIFLIRLSDKKGWYFLISFGFFALYGLNILITKIVVIQPIAFYPIVSILVILIFIYLKYEPYIKREVTEFRNDHPERRDNEVFWGNCRSKEFISLKWQTKRTGKIAYNSQGHKISNPKVFPVFVKEVEIKNSENGDELLESLLPGNDFAF